MRHFIGAGEEKVVSLTLQLGTAADLDAYCAFSTAAQARLQAQGVGQYVPSAHAIYREAFNERVRQSEFWVAQQADSPIAGFCLSVTPASWWPDQATDTLYFSSLVVAVPWQQRGVGTQIMAFSHAHAAAVGKRRVRLDCYAGNRRLCAFYERLGYRFVAKIEQHPDYFGHLYESTLS